MWYDEKDFSSVNNMKDNSKDEPNGDQSVCFLCCACGGHRRETMTRVNYTLFLLLVTVLCFVLSAARMRDKLNAIPHFCNEMVDSKSCDNLVGYTAVYRVCFGTALFYLCLSVITLNVKSVEEIRARIHNGFWYIKFLLLIGE